MKVGSLVQYVYHENYVNMITPDRSEIYTVRDLLAAISPQRPIPHWGIRLDEIINELDENGNEMMYVAGHFIEVQPPIPEIIEELLSVDITA